MSRWPPEWAWREHGDLLALIVRARGGAPIVRKRVPDPRREALVEAIWPLVKANGYSPRDRARHLLQALENRP